MISVFFLCTFRRSFVERRRRVPVLEVLAVDQVDYSNSFDDGGFVKSSEQIATSGILNALTKCRKCFIYVM